MSALLSPRTLALCLGTIFTSTAWAMPSDQDTVHLSPMTEIQLRAESAVEVPAVNEGMHQSVKMRVLHIERDLNEQEISAHRAQNLDILPAPPMPDTSEVSPWMLQHVNNIASGLQSSDPREGLYIMLEPFGIDRNATNVQISRDQFSQNNPFPVPNRGMR